MKENYKCEQYLHIFLKLPQAGFKLDYWINKLIDKYVLFLTICREEQDIFLLNFYFPLVVMKLLIFTK